MANSKVGFLTSGAGGNPTGIGNYVNALHSAGIPAVVMCNDGTVGISDAIATGGNHILLYRIVKDGTEAWSVPDYNLSPKDAAQKHWDKLRPFFNSEFITHKNKIWWQPINEVDKGRADWLGNFAVEFATIANGQGYKVAMFAWSSGEPEPEHWRMAGMMNYLKYCAAHKETAAVALHEYDYGRVGMENVYPWHIGRFQELYKACDELGIERPYVLITEFGWSYNDVPSQEQVLKDVDFAAGIYAKYRDVLGAAIWYLGPGFSNIANKVQPLITPITDFTLTHTYPEEPMPDCKGLPREPYTRRYNVIPASATEQQAIDIFLEGWRRTRETTGGSYDDAGIGDLPVKIANLYGIADSQKQVFINWYAQHYPGTIVNFLPIPGDNPENPFGLGR